MIIDTSLLRPHVTNDNLSNLTLIIFGLLIGQSPLSWLTTTTETVLIPFYTLAVVVYLTAVAFRRELAPYFRPKVEPAVPTPLPLVLPEVTDEEPQPCDLTGAYQLVRAENFEDFLAAQGVPWALRTAAGKARPIHRITHRGRVVTIKIEALIESQTTYIVNGPPVETNIRGRLFEDRIEYLENHQGIRVRKRALTENYDIEVVRELSEDKSAITMTSTATFKDGKDPIACVQYFERIEG